MFQGLVIYHHLATEELHIQREEQDQQDFLLILEAYQFRGYNKGARKVLLTDITYIINGKAPRCYMSTIIDACTKELLAWVLSVSLEIDFVLETVNQLTDKHGNSLTTATLLHSDKGSHYKSIKFIQLIKDSELRQSMSRKANCWDNAPQESFFWTYER